MNTMKKYYFTLSVLLLLNIISILIDIHYSLFIQITLCLLTLTVVAVNIKFSYDFLKEGIINISRKTGILILLFFVAGCILVLPYEIKIRTISFNYSDCLPMIFSYLIAITAIAYFTSYIYIKQIKFKKIIAILLLLNIAGLCIKTVLLVFGLYLDKNFSLLYAYFT